MIVQVLLSSFIFACAAAAGIAAAQMLIARVERFQDGPPPRRLHPAVPIAFMAALGFLLALRGANTMQLSIVAILGVPLIGSWYSDAQKGIVPDVFTLVPLAGIAVYVVLHHAWAIALYSGVTFGAFGCAALISRGKGMGWGDAKLAAVAGAILGLPWSFGVLGTACLTATIVSIVRDRGKAPIAFAPYISVFVLLATTLIVHP
ncbi:MAG TPA: A24 family peptidase [Candidatus Baltobacteraceae bacterium]|jgi:prepilin signal peptidase PulO-like enzyme (type II secretory pathway)|nr:A24 family peptidase [Candidatus Baltobacteraceae bacterium]